MHGIAEATISWEKHVFTKLNSSLIHQRCREQDNVLCYKHSYPTWDNSAPVIHEENAYNVEVITAFVRIHVHGLEVLFRRYRRSEDRLLGLC